MSVCVCLTVSLTDMILLYKIASNRFLTIFGVGTTILPREIDPEKHQQLTQKIKVINQPK